MNYSRTPTDIMVEKLAEGLDSTHKLTQALLNEIREGEADTAAIKTELNILKENVKGLSTVLREGNGATSVVTRLALIEQKLDTIDKWIDDHMNTHRTLSDQNFQLRKQVEDLDNRIRETEKYIDDIKEKEKSEMRAKMDSISKEKEIEHHEKLKSKSVSEARQQAAIRVFVAVVIALVSFFTAYFMKDMK